MFRNQTTALGCQGQRRGEPPGKGAPGGGPNGISVVTRLGPVKCQEKESLVQNQLVGIYKFWGIASDRRLLCLAGLSPIERGLRTGVALPANYHGQLRGWLLDWPHHPGSLLRLFGGGKT